MLQESGRLLRTEETALIRTVLANVYSSEVLENELRNSRVVDMPDGGMGSIRFLGSHTKTFGMELAEAQYLDSDGVLVSISINADKQGELFELDFWKVDFSPLKRYPNPSDLSGISTAK
jgi:hypothetical protein